MSHASPLEPMTAAERRTGAVLAAIFGLRMLGLFLLLPVFALLAQDLSGGENHALVGFALGAYGITQALLQIPFGIASDRWGRKPVIVAGLLLFAGGSFLAAAATDLVTLIIARIIQGAGAISAAVTALAADLTREAHRTKVMAMIGASIGLVFAGSLVIAPPLAAWLGLSGLFLLIGVLALIAIGLLLAAVPPAPPPSRAPLPPFRQVFWDARLARLNLGVFMLHLMQTALWVVVPAHLVAHGLPQHAHWSVYLPALLASFAIMVPAIIAAERHGRLTFVYRGAIGALLLAEIGLLAAPTPPWATGCVLFVFFTGFNILEAIQPSWISRLAPAAAKGAALGIYNTVQSAGLFCGGALGGWLAQRYGAVMVPAVCAFFAFVWLLSALAPLGVSSRAR
ncbi:MAG: MFS transporter [Rhodocyclaceae bacterium]|nr:MFS transporter [Rhodocyclaceae bacterium]